MTIFRITPDASVHTTADFSSAFNSDSPGADTLIVDSNAFLVAEGNVGKGAFLGNKGAWTVIVNGSIFSRQAVGLVLAPSNAAVSTITIG